MHFSSHNEGTGWGSSNSTYPKSRSHEISYAKNTPHPHPTKSLTSKSPILVRVEDKDEKTGLTWSLHSLGWKVGVSQILLEGSERD